jgi:integrase
MRKPPSILFVLRKVNAKGVGTVAAQIFVHSERTIRSLPIHIPSECWDADRRRVRHVKGLLTSTEAHTYNMMIVQMRDAFTRVITHMHIKGENISMHKVMDQMDNANHGHCFHAWAQKRIAELEGVHSNTTLRHYRCTFLAFREFMPECTYADLTDQMVDRFEHWLIRTKGIRLNSRSKYHKHLKTFTRELARSVPGIPDIYESFPIRQVPGQRHFLNREEVQRLQQLYKDGNISPHLMPSLAMFLFSTRTGLRFTDLLAVRWDQVRDGYLSFMPAKTERIDKRIDVPLSDDTLAFCHNRKGRMFDRISNVHYNRNLKEIARAAGITKTISAHVGRHTFATGYLTNGGNIHVLQRIMGHADIDTTQVYVHIGRIHIEQERNVLDTMY